MGRKKRFIDKKNSATFHLLARDSSSFPEGASPPHSDRVFVRVDSNPYHVPAFLHDDQDDDNQEDDSIFADAPGDEDDDGAADEAPWAAGPARGGSGGGGALSEHVRRDILELGLPDDGYNYLIHLREISVAGAGSAYYHNSKARLDRTSLDVKAYDASRLRISSEAGREENNSSGDLLYAVASRTVGVKVQKALDPDVLRLLNDDDLSRFGSDVEDLEEDFVVKANQLEEGEENEQEELSVFSDTEKKVDVGGEVALVKETAPQEQEDELVEEDEENEVGGGEKPRIRRLLDDQFDLLTLREYDDDSDIGEAGYVGNEDEPLAAKLNDALKEYAMDDLELEDKYRVPGDCVHGNQRSSLGAKFDVSADVIQRCAEYAEMYYNEDKDDEEVVLVQESSDESEIWDCETIVSTYSNLDNHPGKIAVPGNPMKRVQKSLSGDSAIKSNLIALRGKEKLPVDYLPQNKRTIEKVKKEASSESSEQRRKPHGQESREEKKERKAAVKEERREARRAKKELKGLYRCETQRAQKVAAVSGPSSIHIM